MIPNVPISRRRLWLMRVLAMILGPLLVLGGVELGLRLGGYGFDPGFFSRIQISGRGFFVPNEKFSYRFFPPALARSTEPFRFPAEKAADSYRIFLLGESAANGDPDPTYGVGRYLAVLLRERYPGTDFQVVCVAMPAIDSSVILPIARECARHQGDLWVIYMGNNEMIGPFGAETSYGLRAPSLGVIRAITAVKATRTGELIDALIRRFRGSSTPAKWGGMEMFSHGRIGYDDPARLRVYANFKGNLEDILQTAIGAGVPVILSTVAVNLKDCSPFASVHPGKWAENQQSRWDHAYRQGIALETEGSFQKALEWYRKAAEIDPRFADLPFRMGRCGLALSDTNQARRDFEWARDCDALAFRADSRINSAVREAAARHAGHGVRLADAAQALAQNSPDGIPGVNFFYEHVHLNFAGNYLLALQFADQVSKLLPGSITANDRHDWASPELCDRRLAVTVWDRQRDWRQILSRVSSPPFTGQFDHSASLKMYEAKWAELRSMMNTQTPEQARRMYEEALRLEPDDCFLHGNFERFLEAGGFLEEAIAEARRCCELVPWLPGGYYYVGTLLVRQGRTTEAAEYFSRALAVRRNYAEALDGMGQILANRNQTAEAIGCFKRAIRASPTYVQTHIDLGFLLQSQGDVDGAAASYGAAARLQPEGPADYFNRAQVAAALFQWDRAMACLRGVVEARPSFWQARYQLGIQLAAKGELEEAQAQFREASRYRPDFVPAHLHLGTALLAGGKPDQALAQFRAVLQLDPANGEAKQQIARIEARPRPGP